MKSTRPILLAVIAVLFVAQGILHATTVYPTWKKDYMPKSGLTGGTGLNPDQFLFALVGLREFVAGILWVRADNFFETGQYDAILPVIRLVTWLDPKQVDVYATGMWHMAYNFTDEAGQSDRRYIKPALALGAEGAARNDYTYELYHETGWIWYHKIDDDYENAISWFEKAQAKEDMKFIPARKNLLPRAYERSGQIDMALATQVRLRADAKKRVMEATEPDYTDMNNLDVIEQNMDNLLVRMSQRGWIARKRGDGSYEAGNYDTKKQHDVKFSVKVTVESPKVLKIEGTWNVLPIGTRIRVILRDSDYDTDKAAGLHWGNASAVDLEPERKNTIMQDGLFVRNGRFTKRIDMSKDPTMYPFVKKDYIIEFFYNPRSAPDHFKDRFGFDGEGMTDANFINDKIRPGARVLYTKLSLTRDQLLQEGDWYGRSAVVKTANFKADAGVGSMDDIIVLPSIRSDSDKKK
ncbi:MAG: hypothetical protein WAO58_09880 [Fimbriimonadaceae bacterium]